MKIGIFGGCFNPPHYMHEFIPKELIESGIVDRIIYVPTGNNYEYKKVIDFKHRYNMLKFICEENNHFSISDYENTQIMKQTYETLDYFQAKYPDDEIFFVMGIESLKEIDTWGQYEYMLKNYKFIINSRSNIDKEKCMKKYKEYNDNIIYSDIEEVDISSTMIRKDIHKMKEYLNPKVYEYIIKHNLY